MSAERAVFLNQLITIESEAETNGSGLLTLTCPVNDTRYMQSLLEVVQNWQVKGGGNSPIGTDARIENSQVICELIPKDAERGALTQEVLQGTIMPDLVRTIESQTARAMGASAATGGVGMTGEEDYETMRGS